MAPHEELLGRAGGPSPRESMARRTAVRRLEAALIEQARLGDGYERSVGTSAEQASYLRLRDASGRVSDCDRAVKVLAAAAGPVK